jgi:hypothetical protein
MKRSEELHNNLTNLSKNVEILNIEYFNSMNSMKNISIKKFVEHVVDNNQTPITQSVVKKENKILSKEEREENLLNKFRHAISLSLEGLNIKNLIDLKENNEGSMVEEDAVSVTSSRYFSHMQRGGKWNLKLPNIIGTNDFFRNEYLGVNNDDRRHTEVQESQRRITNLTEGVEVNLNPDISDNQFITSPKKQNIPNVPLPNPNIPNVHVSNGNIPNVPSVPIRQNTPNVPKVPNVPSVAVNSIIPTAIQSIQEQRNPSSPPSRKIAEPRIDNQVNDNKPLDLKASLEQRFRGQTVAVKSEKSEPLNDNKELPNHSIKGEIKLDAFLRRNTTRQANFYKIDDDDDEEEGPLFKKIEPIKPIKNNLFDNNSETDKKPVELPKPSPVKPVEETKPKVETNINLESIFY